MSIWPTWSLTGDDAALARYVVPDEVAGLVRDLPPAALVDSRITQLRAVYEALAAHGIVYDHEEPTDDAGRQAIREPGEVLWAPGRGTCLDLALVMAGACLKAGLHPVIVLVDSTSGGASHALLGVWVRDVDGEEGGSSGVWHTPPPAWDRLASESGSGRRPPLVLVDPVGIAKGLATTSTRGLNADFDEATRSAARYLTPPPSDGTAAAWTWRVGVDIKHLWRAGATHPTTDRPAGDPLREPYITLDTVPERARTPMQLLRADYGVVPFQARDELTVLTDWCHSVAAGELTGVAVVHGSGGAGKTRLALELAHRMHTRHDWYTGYLKNDDPLDWLGTVVTPTLIVVDYADAASERTRELLRVLSLRRGTPAAVLMTARSVDGDWLNKLRSSWTHRGQLCNELRLRLAPEHPARQRLFRSALGAYATDRVTAAADLEASIDALVPDQWSTLDYVLLGLLAARRQGPLPSTRGELYDEVLVHEHRYWAQTYEDLTTTGKAPSAVLARAAASLTLRAPTTDAQAHAALSAVDELSVDSRWREAVRTTLTACLRPGPGEPLVVRPDPIADHLTLARLADDPDLLARILDNLEPDALLQTLHHLNRAAAADPDTAESRLLAWINADPDRWPAVLRVAATQGGAVLGVLEASVRQSTGPAWLDDLAEALPDAHTGLVHLAHAVEARRLQDLRSDQATPPATLAAQLTRFSRRQADIGEHGAALDSITEAVDHYVILAQVAPAAFLHHLAGALNNLSNQQSETGDRDAALTSITEAVHHHRALAQTNPAAFLPNLATSLNNLSVRQSDIGNRDAALASISEAVQLRRTLAQTNPAVFLPDLAGALNNLSNQQSETGDRDAALTSITEAVHHHRALAQTNPAAFLPNLAGSLHNLSNRQSETGDRDAALTSITEAVAHYRALAQTNPAVFLRNLAGALNNLSVQQSETGDRDAALTSITEAVQLRRTLAQSNPAVFLPDLAGALNNLSGRQSETGDRDAALTSITEAVAHYRALAQSNPAVFLPDLAGALNNLSVQQSETGDRDAALTSITEAVAHYRALAQTNPAAFLPNLATSLNNLSIRQSETGDRDAALTSITEAVQLRRTLAQSNPAAFLPDLAGALNNLSNRQSETGDRDAALTSITEAVHHHRALAQTNPAAFLPNLATSLNNLSIRQSDIGDRDAALTSITEAVAHYRALAQTNPAAFLPNLAGALGNLSNQQSETGDRDAALTSITEAVAHYRALAQTNPAAFLHHLGMSLNNLSNQQSETGDRDAALTSITEAVAHYRALAQTNPAVFLPHLAGFLNNLSNQQFETGDRDAALTSITEAVAHYRALAQTNPAAFLHHLAGFLNNLSNQQFETGDRDAALTSITEAVAHYRALAQTNPAAFLHHLAMSLNNLSVQQSETGDHDAALTSITEAIQLRRTLTRANPAAFLPDLAMSLNNLSKQRTEGSTDTTWLGALDDLEATPVAAAELRTNYARYLMNANRPSEGISQLVRAAEDAHRGPSHRLGVTRRAIRDTVFLSAIRDARLPAWALHVPDDEEIRVMETWVEIEDWAEVEAFVNRHSVWLQTASNRTDIDATRFLYPELPAFDRLGALMDAITQRGVDAVLAEGRSDEARRVLVDAWVVTATWEDSIRFLAEHASDLRSPEVRELLATSDMVDGRRYLAILDLSGHMTADDVLTLITDPTAATGHALDAVEHADLPLMMSVLAACPPTLETGDANAAILTAVLALAAGAADEARACATQAAENANDLQRRAHAIRLRALHRGRPDLEGAAELAQIVDP